MYCSIFEAICDPRERLTAIRGVIALAHCDDILSPAEEKAILAYAELLELSADHMRIVANELSSGAGVQPSDLVFADQTVAKHYLRELLVTAYGDDEYSADERAFVKDVASVNGVSQEWLEQVEGWVDDGHEWKKRGDALFAQG